MVTAVLLYEELAIYKKLNFLWMNNISVHVFSVGDHIICYYYVLLLCFNM